MFIVLASSLGAALIFRWVRLPRWPLTGGLVGAASVNLGFDLGFRAPESFLVATQLLIGTAIGANIRTDILRQFSRIFFPGTLAVGTILGAGLLFGWAFAAAGLMEPQEALFSLIPGGVGELVTAAVTLGVDGSLVISAHVVRLFTVFWSLPLVFWAAEQIYRRWIRQEGSD